MGIGNGGNCMIIDARTVPSGTIIDTEVCIVGAGAAGITLAREFIDSPFRVALLESGGMDFDQDTQQLYEGQSVGLPFDDLTVSRLRYFGGTTNHWGGYCLPLDPIDFEPRDEFPYHGWPFSKSHLDPWYQRAQEVCKLGPYDYRPSSWGISDKKVPPPFSGPHFEPKLLQENPVRFGPDYAPELRRAPRVTVYLYANAMYLDGGETDSEIKELSVKTLSGDDLTIRARMYVLATGGIENVRLLLASGKQGGSGLGNAHDLVGRFFMVHLIYSAGTIVPSDPHMNFDFQTKGAWVPGQYRVDPLIGLTTSTMRGLHLPNIIMGWVFQLSPVVGAVDALKRLVGGEGPGGSRLTDLSKVIGNLEGVADFAVRKTLFGQGIPIEAMHVWCASEQQPNPQSRISLGSKRDHLGMREVVVDWRLVAGDKSQAAAIVHLLGAEIGRAGFGRLRSAFGEDDAWPKDFQGNQHHMGATRMHRDPAQGVVDENCRVHTVANLYIASSSVFPTGGASNPTLTIVALALRLADHLKQQLA
jgi:choline dehydrogenase-like flavoprotein